MRERDNLVTVLNVPFLRTSSFIFCLFLSIVCYMAGNCRLKTVFIFSFIESDVYAQEQGEQAPAQQEQERDPFEPLVSKEGTKPVVDQPPVIEPPPPTGEVTPPSVNIEGVLWGTDKPLAIIDGEVYGVGEKLKDVDAEIDKIEKNKVFILYQGQVFGMGIKSKL